MENLLVINVQFGETRVAVIEDGILAELLTERAAHRPTVGNIYLGKVTRVLPGMQAAFVDIGQKRGAFLHVHDIIRPEEFRRVMHPDPETGASNRRVESVDPDEGEEHTGFLERPRLVNKIPRSTPIRDVISEGDQIVVQISKDPIGTKGARVTSHISLPGRYVVYSPTSNHIGISRRIGSPEERKRLREAIDSMLPPVGGLIVRTVAEGLTKKQLKQDISYLVLLWEEIVRKRDEAYGKAPKLLYAEPDLVLQTARDMFSDKFDKIVIDSKEHYERLVNFTEKFMPSRRDDIELYDKDEPIFDEYGIDDEIRRALGRKISLPSGGYLIIDQAEALTAIDVNTGRFVGKGMSQEETILKTNLEAVEEIAYQLRFRNIGGLIVLDLIDMDRPEHREQVHKKLQALMSKDKVPTTINPISEFGLIEMTRKRTRASLGRQLHETCFYCDGTGHINSRETVALEILREVHREYRWMPGYEIVIQAHSAVVDMLQHEMRDALKEAERRFMRRIRLVGHNEYHLEQFKLEEPSRTMTNKGSEEQKKRQAERVTINKEFASFDEFLDEYVTNISRSGAYVRSKNPLPVGTKVNLRFTVIMDDIEVIEGTGEVVRVDENGMGVVFRELTNYSKELIEKLLMGGG